MILLQIILGCLVLVDVFLCMYINKFNLVVEDDYYQFQKNYGIKSFTIIKILVGLFFVYTLPEPYIRYGPILTVPAYGFFVFLLIFHTWKAIRHN